jgi:hypothetical protein
MDPTACWQRYLDALVERDRATADAALLDLRVWLDNGGHPPTGFTYAQICALTGVLPARHKYEIMDLIF